MARASNSSRLRRAAVLLVATSAFLALGSGAAAGAEPEAVPGEIVVRYDADASPPVRASIRERAGVVFERDLLLPNLQLVRVRTGVSASSAIAALERDPRVRYAEPNFLLRPARSPDDPLFREQWNLHNTGQVVNGVAGVPGADVSAPVAWDFSVGSHDVKVAVLDSGIEYPHPDLAPNMWRNPGEHVPGEERNGVDDDGNGFADDLHGWDFLNRDSAALDHRADDERGHGTPVAAIIGAVGDNATATAGLGWNTTLLSLRVCSDVCSISTAIDATVYARDIGADVANLSFGDNEPSQAHRDAMGAAPSILFVAAAGNGGTDNDQLPFFPCGYDLPNVICVTATDHRDDQVYNYGTTSVDLGAPGFNLLAMRATHRKVFRDDFEQLEPRWDYPGIAGTGESAGWRRSLSTDVEHGLVLSDGDSGNYADDADLRVQTLAAINLAAEQACHVRLDALLDTESSRDHLRVEAAASATGPFVELNRVSGSTVPRWRPVTGSLSRFEGGPVHLRLRFTSDGANTRGGVSVDNVEVRCDDAGTYQLSGGTSYAAPHVAGAAALVKAKMPHLTVAQLRERLLRTVDRLPSLEGKTVTGGRLNVARALTADLDPPTVSVDSRPSPLLSSRSATFAFTASEPESSFECRLDDGAFAACSSPKTYDDLLDGEHAFSVRARDESGNLGPAVDVRWRIDTAPPAVSITQAPSGSTTSRAASIAFGSEPEASLECRLDGGVFAACASPKTYDDLDEGLHAFEVRARDAAGNVGAPAGASWTVDTGAPTVTVESRPPPADNSSSASFGFSASEASVQFECRLDGAAYAGCTSPHNYASLADGEHAFSVRARDAAGNVGPAAHVEWTVDTIAPTASVLARPAQLTSERAARFGFTGSEPSVTFECRLDGAPAGSCASPLDYAELAEGDHAFSVRARDPAGNVGPAAEVTWTVDATPPAISIADGPSGSTDARAARFSFASPEAVAGFECRIDGGEFTACASPAEYGALGVGEHEFAVRARDAAGNLSDPPARRSWTVVEQAGADRAPADDPGPGGAGIVGPLRAPDLSHRTGRPPGAPALSLALRRQRLQDVLRFGLRARALVRGACPCRVTYTLRVGGAAARSLGLTARRGTRPTVIGRALLSRVRAGGHSVTVRLSRLARLRLRSARAVNGHLEATLTDGDGQTVVARRALSLRR